MLFEKILENFLKIIRLKNDNKGTFWETSKRNKLLNTVEPRSTSVFLYEKFA